MSKVINYNKCWCLDRPWCFTSGFTLAFCNLPTQYSLIFSSSTNGDNDKTLLLQLILICDNKFNVFSENEWFCAIFVNVSYDGPGKQFSEVLNGSWKSQKDSRSFKRFSELWNSLGVSEHSWSFQKSSRKSQKILVIASNSSWKSQIVIRNLRQVSEVSKILQSLKYFSEISNSSW